MARCAPPERAYIDAIGAQQRPLEDYVATAVGKVEAHALDAVAGISSIVHGLKNIYAELRRIEPGRCALGKCFANAPLECAFNSACCARLRHVVLTATGTI